MNRCDIGSDGKTLAEAVWPKGQHTNSGVRGEDFVHAGQVSEREKMGTAIPVQSVCGDAELVVRGSGCHRASERRSRHAQRTLSRIPESERWDAHKILGMQAVPWPPDGSDNAFDIQVGLERPAEMMPRVLGDVLMENKVVRNYLRRADFEQWHLSEGCPGCRYLRTGQGRQQAHSEACQRRIEGLLKGDPVWCARLAAADERINRALADAVERHATKDPGVRGILKRSSVACHPESESSEESCARHRAGSHTTTSCLIRGIIGVRCATQRHHQHRPGHRHELEQALRGA